MPLPRFCHVEIDVPFWSQHISFLFVGIIIAASIRGLLNQLMKVLELSACSPLVTLFTRCAQLFYTYSSSVTSSSIVLVLAHVMGMYFTSSVLLLRMSLPLQYRCVTRPVRCAPGIASVSLVPPGADGGVCCAGRPSRRCWATFSLAFTTGGSISFLSLPPSPPPFPSSSLRALPRTSTTSKELHDDTAPVPEIAIPSEKTSAAWRSARPARMQRGGDAYTRLVVLTAQVRLEIFAVVINHRFSIRACAPSHPSSSSTTTTIMPDTDQASSDASAQSHY